MKKKILFISIISLLLVSFICLNSYAVGWADMEDENGNSGQGTQKQETKQEEQYDYTLSTNNYLKSLLVEKYTISPSFDKQVINYTIKNEVKEDTITINAEAEDERAQVVGIGKVELKPGKNEVEINVIAESGTYKTYFINLTRYGGDDESTSNTLNNVETNSTINSESQENDGKDISKKTVISAVIVIFLVILVFVAISRTSKSPKGKRSRR